MGEDLADSFTKDSMFVSIKLVEMESNEVEFDEILEQLNKCLDSVSDDLD